jgi:hypothetical protein
MSRTQPTEIREHPLLTPDPGPPVVRLASSELDYSATYSRELLVSGHAWLLNRNGQYMVLPRGVELYYRQHAPGGPWTVHSATVCGPAQLKGERRSPDGELCVSFRWGSEGLQGRPDDAPAWLADAIETYRPTSEEAGTSR